MLCEKSSSSNLHKYFNIILKDIVFLPSSFYALLPVLFIYMKSFCEIKISTYIFLIILLGILFYVFIIQKNIIAKKLAVNILMIACGILIYIYVYFNSRYVNEYYAGTELNNIKNIIVKVTAKESVSSKLDKIKITGLSVISEKNMKTDIRLNAQVLVRSGCRITAGMKLDLNRKGFVKVFNNSGILSDDDFNILKSGNIFWHIRNNCLEFINKHTGYMNKSSRGIFKAMFLGDRSQLGEDNKSLFVKSGTVHLLALSGTHIGVLVVFINILMGLMKVKKGLRYVVLFSSLIFYLSITGLRASLLRAVVMYFIYLVAGYNGNRTDAGNIIVLAFLLNSVLIPDELETLSFLLSFAAAGGIVFFTKYINYYFSGIMPGFISVMLSVSLSAQLLTFPLIVYYINEYRPLGMLATIAVSPFVFLFISAGIIFIIFSMLHISLLAEILDYFLFYLSKAITGILKLGSLFDLCIIINNKKNIIYYFIFILLMIIIFYLHTVRKRAGFIKNEL